MKDTVRNREQGMMTVEAVLSLVPFILLVMGIISCINIFMVHNKMQYALFQSASELSAYTYFYEAFGIRAADLELKEDMDQETVEMDTSANFATSLIVAMFHFLSANSRNVSTKSTTIPQRWTTPLNL